jgi:phospholipase/carboxylesterase
MIDRRELFKLGLGALAFGCASAAEPGRLRARPGASQTAAPLKPPAILYVPPKPTGAFALILHGATGEPDRIINRLRPDADEFGVTLLAPKSQDITWDAIRGTFGPDVAAIDDALRAAFATCKVDRKHVAVAGFSDGATYALALGRANGDLFTHVMAFSPGFLIPVDTVGHARFFLSHGTKDEILPIDGASRRIARDLRRENLSVKLREFDGPHTVPPEIAREGFAWFTQP